MKKNEFLDLIDFSRLSRNFFLNPPKNKQDITKQDLEYLYIDLNLSLKEIEEILSIKSFTLFNWVRSFEIKKSKEQRTLCRKRTCLEIYGCESSSGASEIMEKAKQTCLKHFGVDNIFKRVDLIKQGMLNKHGVDNSTKIPGMLERRANSYKAKTGYDHPIHNPEAKQKQQETIQKHYGVDNPMKSSEVREKAKQTCLERYGVDHPSKNPEISTKMKESIKAFLSIEENLNRRTEQIRQTRQERYGDPNFTNRELTKQTKQERYGDPNFNNREKAKQTCLERYDTINVSQDFNIKDKKKATFQEHYGVDCSFQAEEVKEKIKQTCLERYGTFHYTKSSEYKDKFKDENFVKKIQEKIYQTKKSHNSFNSSKPEELIHLLLLEKFPNCKRWYKEDSRYPFECDFYIPSLDLFIEINFHWTHGFHPYNPQDPKDLETVKAWEVKAKELNFKGKPKYLYKKALEIWTERDVYKREIAKSNYLNYLEFFNEEEFLAWYNSFNEDF